MSYREQGWAARFQVMGDDAEEQFEKWCDRIGMRYDRNGWDRPASGVGKMKPLLRNKPDYYASDGYLYEVVGMGTDDVLKGVKVEKWEALKFWNSVQPTRLFVYHSKRKALVMLPWPALVGVVARARRDGIKSFKNDGNEYYPIRWSYIEAYQIGDAT